MLGSLLKRLLVAGSALAALVVGYGWLVESKRLVVERVTMPIDGLPPHLDGFTLVQLTDFHPGSSHASVISKAVDITNHLKPDLVVLTGDFIDRHGSEVFELLEPFGRLSAPYGVYASLGNHDIWQLLPLRKQIVTYGLTYVGIPILNNEYVRLENGIVLAGICDTPIAMADLPAALKGVSSDDTVITLVHRPDYADAFARDGRVDLQLSGHTHGGQMVVPGIKPLYLPHYGKKYVSGRHRIGNMWLYVSRGVGTARIPVRLNCPPEITHITLRRAA